MKLPVMISSIFCFPSSSLALCNSNLMFKTRAVPRSGDDSKRWHTCFKFSNASTSLKEQSRYHSKLVNICLDIPTMKMKCECVVIVTHFYKKLSECPGRDAEGFYLSSDMSSFTVLRHTSRETSDSSISFSPENIFTLYDLLWNVHF